MTLAAAVYGLASLLSSSEGSNGTSPSHTEHLQIWERHRHRYEVNPDMVKQLEAAGLRFTGRDDTGIRMEIAELSRDIHPFYFGTQYHPEVRTVLIIILMLLQ